MKLYRRLGHLKYKRMFGRYERDLFKWALALKPGDLIGACTGFNHVFAKLEVHRWNSGRRGGWYISDIEITDSEGRLHWCPGGGCVCRPYSREEILSCAREFAQMHEALGEEGVNYWQAVLNAESSGSPFIDSRGLYIGPKRS